MYGNAAIPFRMRELVGDCLLHVSSETDHPDAVPLKERMPLYELGLRVRQPGPTLVSLADVDELFKLIRSISALGPGKTLEHPWGKIRRLPGGYVFVSEDNPVSGGILRGYDPVDCAERVYKAHLFSRGLLPFLQLQTSPVI